MQSPQSEKHAQEEKKKYTTEPPGGMEGWGSRVLEDKRKHHSHSQNNHKRESAHVSEGRKKKSKIQTKDQE